MTKSTIRKSTRRPRSSVRRPSPSIPSKRSKTSGWAFSISSRSTRASGVSRTRSARLRDPGEASRSRAAAPGLYARLVTERNERWLTTLKARLDGSGRTVVVVGVGHLVGQDGLPARLRALGYSVEGP